MEKGADEYKIKVCKKIAQLSFQIYYIICNWHYWLYHNYTNRWMKAQDYKRHCNWQCILTIKRGIWSCGIRWNTDNISWREIRESSFMLGWKLALAYLIKFSYFVFNFLHLLFTFLKTNSQPPHQAHWIVLLLTIIYDWKVQLFDIFLFEKRSNRLCGVKIKFCIFSMTNRHLLLMISIFKVHAYMILKKNNFC